MKIEHKDMPGFVMEVLKEKPCLGDERLYGENHSSYKVIDPEGQEDWLCSLDVRIVRT